MLKRPITYTNFNNEKVTEIFYFNLSEAELIDWEVEFEGGLKARLERLIETADRKKTVEFFKDLVLRAFGEKSDDGKYFEKNDQLKGRFMSSAAYPVLFMELATDDKAAADFLKGIVPQSMLEDVEKAMLQEQTANALGKPANG